MSTRCAIDRALEPNPGPVAAVYPMQPKACGGILPATRRVFVAFTLLTLLATNQLLVVSAFTDRYFAWTISVRPNSAFLGAAYAAGFLLAVLALRQNRWRDVRVALVTVTVFT